MSHLPPVNAQRWWAMFSRNSILAAWLILLFPGFSGRSEEKSPVIIHGAPGPLSPDAVTSDWPRFLGPNDDATSSETRLIDSFPETGPALVWERPKGTGYTSPVFAEGKGVLFDREGDEEIVIGFDPENGADLWRFGYPIDYSDRYGFSNGPRASAVINSGKVYTLGVRSMLTCLDLTTGQKIWQRNLDVEYEVAPNFFGQGSCPLVYEGKVIVNLGGKEDHCVVAFDANDGAQIWVTRHPWKSSYSSPVVKELQGAPRLLVFAGGESNPSTGGLLGINPATGELLDAFPWRSRKFESVNSATPVAAGENRVFISECYSEGGVLLELTPDLKWKEIWKAPGFNLHWMTPIVHEGHLYGFLGRNEPDAYLGCYDIATGRENWKKDIIWKTQVEGRNYNLSYFRGSILRADGKFFVLGEFGTLAIMNLKPEGFEETSRAQLFYAQATWSLPVLYRGLLYVSQHESEFPFLAAPKGHRLVCYDLRK